MTKTYIFIRNALAESPVPMDLRELHRRVLRKYKKIAFSTIWRIVRDLEREGKVTKSDWRQRMSTYEWAERRHHHHIICDRCGDIQDITDSSAGFQAKRIVKETGFALRSHSIEMSGLCPDCKEESHG